MTDIKPPENHTEETYANYILTLIALSKDEEEALEQFKKYESEFEIIESFINVLSNFHKIKKDNLWRTTKIGKELV